MRPWESSMGPEGENAWSCLFLLIFFFLPSRNGRERDFKGPESCSQTETFNRIIRISEISILPNEGRLSGTNKNRKRTGMNILWRKYHLQTLVLYTSYCLAPMIYLHITLKMFSYYCILNFGICFKIWTVIQLFICLFRYHDTLFNILFFNKYVITYW